MFLLTCLVLGGLPAAARVLPNVPHLANSFLDRRDYNPYNLLGYTASNTLTGIAFSLVLAVALIQTFHLLNWGAWWMACMTIGAYTFALGIACRFGLHVKPDSKGIYIAENLFVILPPCAFIAADYILLGRLARYIGSGKHLVIPPSRITITFVISDTTTFLIQVGASHQSDFSYGIMVHIQHFQATGGAVSVGATTMKVQKLDIPWRSDYSTDLISYLYTNLLAFCVSCTQI